MKNKYGFIIGIFISILYFIIHLAIINDYGVSWDYHYHLYAGLHHLGLPVPSVNDPSPVPFSSPDPRLSINDPFGPFTQIIPALSQVILFDKLRLFSLDSAYNFPMLIFGSLGVGILFIFVYETVGLTAAFISSTFLALFPSYFAYLHNNMKDIPNAVFYTVSIYLFWRLVQYTNIKNLIFAVLAFAFAFNIKINSILIPFVCLIWFILSRFQDFLNIARKKNYLNSIKKKYLVFLYFIFGPIAAVLLWWPFWENPLGKLLELPYFYSHNTLNMPVLLMGQIFYSGVNIPWFYPFYYIGITSPISILISFIVGLFVCFLNLRKKNFLYLLLVIWFFLPLVRYFNPKSGAIDGIRHFMEIIFPMCFIAGIGATFIYKKFVKNRKSKILASIVGLIILIFLIKNIIEFHPYQTSFFNYLIGGIKGAEGQVDIDFWGTPQKSAMIWLNKNASIDSTIYVAMAQSSAGIYLRPDLLKKLNSQSIENSDYIVILNRQSFYKADNLDFYIKNKEKEGKLVFTKSINGVPLVRVFREK
uniref:Glycosyltransferase RgtA/B/C/D-like domain-containing protein n=1 Tax=candidate division CPR3 bacterium TaxID=2268181 RepID=A0A7C4M117_UNCC3